MKNKTLKGKLTLKKQTIVSLKDEEMRQSKGMGTGYACGTRTCTPTQCDC